MNQCCDIFISQDRINPVRLFSNQTRSLFESTNLNSQQSKTMKFSVVSIVVLVALFSQGLAASVQHCASYYHPLPL